MALTGTITNAVYTSEGYEFETKEKLIQKILYRDEDIEVAHLFLDDLKIPRKDINGKKFSLVGRIKLLVL